ncbi:MAG: SDR family oxidoreductase [Actinomycetota bacterium]|nr:SDR family oxidoreductase [Actinomycetota bacterium]
MAGEGATVVVNGRRQGPLDEVVAAIGAAGGKALTATADLTDDEAASRLADRCLADHGCVDVLVNNAGFSSSVRSARHLDAATWTDVWRVNVLGPAMLARALLPAMIDAGGGTIITVSSVAGLRPNVMAGAAYGSAKAAVANWMTELASEVRNLGVRCSTIFPGEIDTPILDRRALPPDDDQRAMMARPEDVAEAVLLCATLPARAMIDELVITPTRQRDLTADMAAAREKSS